MTGKKKLLIAGGGYADIPLIQAGQKIGFHVITSGNRPDDAGHRYSDKYQPADFSDTEAMLSLAKKLSIDAICACSNDFSALSSAYVAEKLGLPGHDSFETSKIIHHKDIYRDFALKNSIPTPRAIGYSNTDQAVEGIKTFQLPVIIKPIDLTGGKGITTVYSYNDAKDAIEKAFAISRAKRIVIEEFIEGTRHGFSAFIVEGKVTFYFADNEHYYKNQYMVSAASTPADIPADVKQRLCTESEKIASLLSLKTGIFHIQYILKGKAPVIIEICRRSPGDLYTRFVEHATGVDYPSWIVKSSAGMDCSGLTFAEPKGFFARHCIMSSKPGTVKAITFDKSITGNISDKYMWGKPGDEIDDILTQKFGIVFLKFASQKEMLKKTNMMQELIHVEVS